MSCTSPFPCYGLNTLHPFSVEQQTCGNRPGEIETKSCTNRVSYRVNLTMAANSSTITLTFPLDGPWPRHLSLRCCSRMLKDLWKCAGSPWWPAVGSLIPRSGPPFCNCWRVSKTFTWLSVVSFERSRWPIAASRSVRSSIDSLPAFVRPFYRGAEFVAQTRRVTRSTFHLLPRTKKRNLTPSKKRRKYSSISPLYKKKFNPTNEKSLLRQFCSCPWMAHRELDVYVFSCVVVDVTQWMTSRSDVSWRVCVHTLRCSSMLQWTWIIITSFLYFSDRQHTLPTGSFNNRKNGTKYCGSKPSNFSLEFKQSRHNLLFLILICWKKLKINWTYYSNGFCRIKGLVKAIYK